MVKPILIKKLCQVNKLWEHKHGCALYDVQVTKKCLREREDNYVINCLRKHLCKWFSTTNVMQLSKSSFIVLSTLKCSTSMMVSYLSIFLLISSLYSLFSKNYYSSSNNSRWLRLDYTFLNYYFYSTVLYMPSSFCSHYAT